MATTTGRIQRTEEERRTRPINRLQTMYPLRALFDKLYQETQEAKNAGRPTAWCMVEPFASPLLNAIGMASVYPEQYASVCAAKGAAVAFLDRSEADGFPTHVCTYLQNTFGYAARMMDLGGKIPPEAPQGGMPKPTLLVASGSGCEARYKGFQALGRYLDTPVWTTESLYSGSRVGSVSELLIEGAYEYYVNFLVKEVREFAVFLERLLGKKMDWDTFEADIDNTMEMNRVWSEITDELRKARPCPMNSRDHFSSIAASTFRTSDPIAVKELFQNMYDEVQHRIDNGIAGINREEKYRVSWNGLGPWQNMGILDNLAERGWNFVRESYHPPKPIDLSWVKDPVEKLVRYKQRSLDWEIDDEFEPEEAAKVREELKRTGFSNKLRVVDARSYQLDGAFIQTVLSCRPNAAAWPIFQEQLMSVWKVPSISIVADMIDARSFDMEDIMKKAGAFEETMDYYREVRQKEGLPW